MQFHFRKNLPEWRLHKNTPRINAAMTVGVHSSGGSVVEKKLSRWISLQNTIIREDNGIFLFMMRAYSFDERDPPLSIRLFITLLSSVRVCHV